jgi:rfaE bifunctional protein kinase chain/domain
MLKIMNKKKLFTTKIENCRILVVGDVMLDRYWHGEVTRISPEAPVPIVHIRHEEERLGGAANVALNIKKIGAQVKIISMVGNDEAARKILNLLERHDIDAELGEDPEMETIVKLRVIGQNQQMIRMDFEKEPANEVLASMLVRFCEIIEKYDAVVFSDYGKGGLAHIPQMISKAKLAKKLVFVDPKGSDWSRYAGATVLTPNRSELEQAIGSWKDEEHMLKKAREHLKFLKLKALLVTRSEEGMTLIEKNIEHSISAEAREVADVTGAGDTVIATLAVLVSCGLDLYQAMVLSNKAAGIAVGKFGTASVSSAELLA